MDKPHATVIRFAASSVATPKAPPWTPALLGAVVMAGCGHLLIKFGLNQVRGGVPGGVARWLNPWLFFGLGVYGVGTLLWIFAVSRKQISYLYPITALNYAIVALGGQLLFQEAVTPSRWLGIAIVIAGVVLMQWSAKPFNHRGHRATQRQQKLAVEDTMNACEKKSGFKASRRTELS